ncbi:glycosyltransferase family 4 protein [Rhizobium mesosinicum]|uniref:Glycosyltransferase family 4 protein n=1 Tax=Rhizobium mesosinicum TaxID=335017 RepID=A0ABS7GMQ8_9HYPH|nr:glycosyltransferase family 4 protein [Rhizobium mesosinicum]MBW9051012.1 glycosyltransferase family 4 protein [Rhizobium mesosinicum]
MLIVAVATAWGNREGGINSFNYSFLSGLSALRLDHKLVCVVTDVNNDERHDAEKKGVHVLRVSGVENGRPTDASSYEIVEWLTKNGFDPRQDSVFIGHDIVTGSVAVKAAERCGGRVALIHHMAYEEYQNLRGGLGEKTGLNFDRQQQLFETPHATVFGVGTYLAEKAGSLGGKQPHVLIPGFPEQFERNSALNNQLRIAIAGRFTPDQEPLKQAALPIEALGKAIRDAAWTVKLLEDPTVFIIGVDGDRIREAKLETLASRIAGRHVNIVPRPFNDDPNAVVSVLKQSNLAIVPSFHEGFGLFGWEAIGCEVPLILGRKTGLFKFISSQVGRGEIHSVDMLGGVGRQRDVDAIAEAIVEVAKDLPLAKQDAIRLRERLKTEKGCTWKHTAEAFLSAIDPRREPGLPARKTPSANAPSRHFNSGKKDFFPRCVELTLSENQGSTPERFDVQADLWFGKQPLVLDDMKVELSLRRAQVAVSSTTGRIFGERLGDNPKVAGLEPTAGGMWIVTDPGGGDTLGHRALGVAPICQIETPPSTMADVTVKVLVSPKDVNCEFDLPAEDRGSLKEKLMAIVVQKALLDETTGEVIFSQAELRQDDIND